MYLDGSSARLTNSAPGSLPSPITMGFWAKWDVNPFTGGNAVMVGLNPSGGGSTTQKAVFPALTNVGDVTIQDYNGTTNALATITNLATLGYWFFVLAHWKAVNSRRIYGVSTNDFRVRSATNVTSVTISPSEINIGCVHQSSQFASFFNGHIAEWWYSKTDIGAGIGDPLPDALVLQLAMKGPWSLPFIAKDVAEYRSLRTLASTEDTSDEVYWGTSGKQVWTNNGAIRSIHPPLSSDYVTLRSQFSPVQV